MPFHEPFKKSFKFNLLKIKHNNVLWVLENADSGVRLWVEILSPPLVSRVILEKGRDLCGRWMQWWSHCIRFPSPLHVIRSSLLWGSGIGQVTCFAL